MSDFVTVFCAEFLRRIRSRPFLVGLALGAVGIGLFIKVPQWLEVSTRNATRSAIVIVKPPIRGSAALLLEHDFDVIAVAPVSRAGAVLRRYDAATIIVLGTGPSGLQVTAYARDPGRVPVITLRRDLIPLQLELATSLPPPRIVSLLRLPIDVRSVSAHFGSRAQSNAGHALAATMIFFLYMLILLNTQIIMSSVADEKTSRIAELLVASVDPIALLAGKIASAASLALLQMLVWISVAVVLTMLPGAPPPSDQTPFDLAGLRTGTLSPTVVVAFLVFFVIGFLQLSLVFAALASLINRTEDLGSVSVPLAIPIITALLVAVAALDVPDAPWVVAMSYVPLIAPFVMFSRIAVSDVPLSQIVVSVELNAVVLCLIAIGAGKVYRVGMLMYGRNPSLKQMWSVIRS